MENLLSVLPLFLASLLLAQRVCVDQKMLCFGVSAVSLQYFSSTTPECSDFKLVLGNNDGMDKKFPEFLTQNHTDCVGFFFFFF